MQREVSSQIESLLSDGKRIFFRGGYAPGIGEMRGYSDHKGAIVAEALQNSGHETVFAMTVHKSQGSEFDDILLVLPDRDLPVLTRELLYTAITRARSRFTLAAQLAIFQNAVARRMVRNSGLSDLLEGSSSFLTT